MKATKPRIAVLIDAENISAKLANCLFGKIAQLGLPNVRRIYGNLSKPTLKAWVDPVARHHIESRPDAPHVKKKNVTDATLIIDAMDLLSSGRFDGFCIVSRDSDFAGLAKHIREKGKLVYGVADAPECLRDQCNGVIELSLTSPARA
jgi:hypothetical protein